jgi:hypothetical protein
MSQLREYFYEVNVGDLIFGVPGNHFCELFPFPIQGKNDFFLFYQFIPWTGQTVGMGYKEKIVPSPGGVKKIISLIAFSSIDFMLLMFPDASKVINLGGETNSGVPMQCSQSIVPLPVTNTNFIIEALQHPNQIVTFEIFPNSVQPVPPVPLPVIPGHYQAENFISPTDEYIPVSIVPLPESNGMSMGKKLAIGMGLLLLTS